MKVAIIGALADEISYFCERFGAQIQDDRFEIYTGTYRTHTLYLCRCGVGKVNAAMAAQRLIDRYAPDCLINSGVAGGLDRSLSVLDIAVSSEAVYHDFYPLSILEESASPGTSVFRADETLVRHAADICRTFAEQGRIKNYRVGRIVTGDCFVESDQVSRRLREELGGICVEMEGAAIAHTALANGLPFLIVRSISDFADDNAELSFDALVGKAAVQASLMIEALLDRLAGEPVR